MVSHLIWCIAITYWIFKCLRQFYMPLQKKLLNAPREYIYMYIYIYIYIYHIMSCHQYGYIPLYIYIYICKFYACLPKCINSYASIFVIYTHQNTIIFSVFFFSCLLIPPAFTLSLSLPPLSLSLSLSLFARV